MANNDRRAKVTLGWWGIVLPTFDAVWQTEFGFDEWIDSASEIAHLPLVARGEYVKTKGKWAAGTTRSMVTAMMHLLKMVEKGVPSL